LLPYWLLFSLFAAGSLQYRRLGPTAVQAAPILWAAGCVVAIMIGFRYQVGGDWSAYQKMYESVLYLKLSTALGMGDPGYMLLNWIAAAIGAEIWFVNSVCGFIFSWGLLTFARRQPNPWLAMAVAVPYLVIVVAMGYARQAVAIGIILAALADVERRSLLRFVGYVALAAAFHKSAVVVIPLVALSVTRNRLVTMIILALTAIMLSSMFVSASVDALLTNYVAAEYSSEGAAVRIAMSVLAASIFLGFSRRFSMSNQMELIWKNFSIASFLALVLFFVSPSSTAIDRISLYLMPLQIAVLSHLPNAFRKQGRANSEILLAVLGYSALVQFVWLTFATHAEFWLPYRFYPIGAEPAFISR
jgi:hypothetical protein